MSAIEQDIADTSTKLRELRELLDASGVQEMPCGENQLAYVEGVARSLGLNVKASYKDVWSTEKNRMILTLDIEVRVGAPAGAPLLYEGDQA